MTLAVVGVSPICTGSSCLDPTRSASSTDSFKTQLKPSVSSSHQPRRSMGRKILMVPNAVEGVLGPCGAEIVLHDLASAPDSFFYFAHGRHIIRGRFLLHGVSGPHQGTMSISLRAIPAA